MLCYDRINAFKGIDVNKTSKLKEWNIYHQWYLLNEGFNFKSYVCNKCHDLVIMSKSLADIVISDIKYVDYWNQSGIGKSEAINLMLNFDLTKKTRIL